LKIDKKNKLKELQYHLENIPKVPCESKPNEC